MVYGLMVLTVQFAIPMFLMSVCYGRIFMIIHRDMIVSSDIYRLVYNYFDSLLNNVTVKYNISFDNLI